MAISWVGNRPPDPLTWVIRAFAAVVLWNVQLIEFASPPFKDCEEGNIQSCSRLPCFLVGLVYCHTIKKHLMVTDFLVLGIAGTLCMLKPLENWCAGKSSKYAEWLPVFRWLESSADDSVHSVTTNSWRLQLGKLLLRARDRIPTWDMVEVLDTPQKRHNPQRNRWHRITGNVA